MQKGVMFGFRLQGSVAERMLENNILELNEINTKSGFKTLDPDQEF